MSSSLGNLSPNLFEKNLIRLHQKASHSIRVKVLSQIIYAEFLLSLSDGKKNLKILDFGCGDMQIIHELKKKLPGSTFYGMDIFKLPDNLVPDAYWENYIWFDGRDLPFDHNYFDVVLLIDVLHHIPVEEQLQLLKKIKLVAKFVIIKDHFEFGFFSRQILRLMDFVGNWAYGVQIPRKYFTKSSFASLVTLANFKKIKVKQGINLYQHLKPINFLIREKWQFIYLGEL